MCFQLENIQTLMLPIGEQFKLKYLKMESIQTWMLPAGSLKVECLQREVVQYSVLPTGRYWMLDNFNCEISKLESCQVENIQVESIQTLMLPIGESFKLKYLKMESIRIWMLPAGSHQN